MVHCPTCNTAVLVPDTDQLPELPNEAPAAAPPEQPQGVFERDDFDALLRATSGSAEPRSHNSAVHAPPPRPAAPEPVAPPPLPDPFKVEPMGVVRPARKPAAPSSPAVGVVLSPTRATVLTVVVILLLAIAFGAGLVVGRFYL
jgi:hypothetical protein